MSFPGLLGGIYPNRWAPVPSRPAPAASETPSGELPVLASRGRPGSRIAPRRRTAGRPLDGPVGTLGARPMIPLGQFRDTFIIAIDDEGIAIIDQHVAHERVLFERVMQRLTEGRLESQLLLEPLVVELSAGGCQVLLQRARGTRAVRLRGGGVRRQQPADRRRAGAADARRERRGGPRAGRGPRRPRPGRAVEEALKRIAALTACHAAVKANMPLTHEKMAHILEELRRTAYSTICPHGRPVMLRLTRREIEKNFQRIWTAGSGTRSRG